MVWGGLGVAWDAFGMSLASFGHDFSTNWRLDGRRMGLSSAKLVQDAPKLDHVGAKMAT